MDISYLRKYTKQSIDKNGNTLLHKAIKAEDLTLLYKISSMETNVNKQNKDGVSALHYAVKHGNPILVEAVLQCGIDPLLRNKIGQTASDVAIQNGRNDLVNLIGQYLPGLQTALLTHDVTSVVDLLRKWVNLDNVLRTLPILSDIDKMSIGHYKVANNLLHLVASDDLIQLKLTVEQLAKENSKSTDWVNCVHPISGYNALTLAVRNGSVKMTQFLIEECNGDAVYRLNTGIPLTHFALQQSNFNFFIIIILLRSNPTAWHLRSPDTGNTILFDLLPLVNDQDNIQCADKSQAITDVHISALLRLTEASILSDTDDQDRNFIQACKFHLLNPDRIIKSVHTCIVEQIVRGNVGKLKLLEIVCYCIENWKEIMDVPDDVFEDVCEEGQLDRIRHKYHMFLDNVKLLEDAARNLKEAIDKNDLSGVKKNNIANFKFQDGTTALHKSIKQNRFEISKWLVTERPDLLKIGDNSNKYPLHYAYGVVGMYGNRYVTLLLENSKFEELEVITDMFNTLPCEVNALDNDES